MNNSKLKPAETYDRQILRLINRGMIISDKEAAVRILRKTNYYRLSPYSLGLRDKSNKFDTNITLEQIYRIYLFDSELRHLLLKILEPIEVQLRSEMAYYLGVNYGNVSHLDPELVIDRQNHLRFLSQYYKGLSSLSTRPFVKHNIEEYGELPIWAAVETLSFGTLSKCFGNLKLDLQKPIAESFSSDVSRFSGWLEALSDIRNSCAHSDRIYNRVLTKKVKLYPGDDKGLDDDARRKIFPILIILKKIYQGKEGWEVFFYALSELLDLYKEDINLSHMGFPQYWRTTLDKVKPVTTLVNQTSKSNESSAL